MLLDDIDYYFASNDGVAFTPDGRRALVTSSDADTVSIIDTARLAQRLRQVPAEELANRLDSAATFVVQAPAHRPQSHLRGGFSRQPLGLRRQSPGRFRDRRWTLAQDRRSASTIDLGGPKAITLMRRGEQMFHAAKYLLPGPIRLRHLPSQLAPGRLGVESRDPATGPRPRGQSHPAREFVRRRLTSGMATIPTLPPNAVRASPSSSSARRDSTRQELEALLTYLNNIPLAPNRHLARRRAVDRSAGARQGHLLPPVHQRWARDSRAEPLRHLPSRRDALHRPLSTDVGSATQYDTSGMFDIPQLDRVYEDAPYLHNGEALTLEEIWTVFNNQRQARHHLGHEQGAVERPYRISEDACRAIGED